MSATAELLVISAIAQVGGRYNVLSELADNVVRTRTESVSTYRTAV